MIKIKLEKKNGNQSTQGSIESDTKRVGVDVKCQ